MINLIVACGEDRVIGKNGRLPWTIQEDWDYFMDTTSGGSMIMGKICYQEFEKHIADREVIALTKSKTFRYSHARTAHSLDTAISMATRQPIWICGGEAVYREAFPLASRLYLTLIKKKFEGDVYFPRWETTFSEVVSRNVIKTPRVELEFMVLEKPKESSLDPESLPQ